MRRPINGELRMEFKWVPITRLSEQDKSIDLTDVDSLKSTWSELRAKLAESSAANLEKFSERLARQDRKSVV